MCATVCVDCFDGDLPDCSTVEATKRELTHCAHLGTTIDVMYAKQRAEDEGAHPTSGDSAARRDVVTSRQ